jgi:hypothetical protein
MLGGLLALKLSSASAARMPGARAPAEPRSALDSRMTPGITGATL